MISNFDKQIERKDRIERLKTTQKESSDYLYQQPLYAGMGGGIEGYKASKGVLEECGT